MKMAYYKLWYKWSDVREDQIEVLVDLFRDGWEVYENSHKTVRHLYPEPTAHVAVPCGANQFHQRPMPRALGVGLPRKVYMICQCSQRGNLSTARNGGFTAAARRVYDELCQAVLCSILALPADHQRLSTHRLIFRQVNVNAGIHLPFGAWKAPYPHSYPQKMWKGRAHNSTNGHPRHCRRGRACSCRHRLRSGFGVQLSGRA